MSILLEQDTKPKGLWTKSMNFAGMFLCIGDYTIGPKDFNELVMYVLTNSDLIPNDTRLELIEHIKKLKVVKGFNVTFGQPNSQRLSELTQEEIDDIDTSVKKALNRIEERKKKKQGVMKLGAPKAPKSSRR